MTRSTLPPRNEAQQPDASVAAHSTKRIEIESWIKFWGALVALISGSCGLVYGVGGWILDRQSRSVALAEHRILEAKIEQAKIDVARDTAIALDGLRRELLDSIALTREDQRETQRRIDRLVRASKDLEARMEASQP